MHVYVRDTSCAESSRKHTCIYRSIGRLVTFLFRLALWCSISHRLTPFVCLFMMGNMASSLWIVLMTSTIMTSKPNRVKVWKQLKVPIHSVWLWISARFVILVFTMFRENSNYRDIAISLFILVVSFLIFFQCVRMISYERVSFAGRKNSLSLGAHGAWVVSLHRWSSVLDHWWWNLSARDFSPWLVEM